MPNLAGYEPGTEMDLWSIDPATGLFDKVGTGAVNADGSKVETVAGGIRNSSWHFFAPPPPPPPVDPDAPHNEDDGCDECEGSAGFTSEVRLHSGAVLGHHDLVSYQSHRRSRSLRLTYDSLRADPRPILHFGYDNVPNVPDTFPGRIVAELTINKGKFDYQIPGFAGGEYGLDGGEHFWRIPEGGGNIDASLQADLTGLPSGRYEYELTAGPRLFAGDLFAGTSSTSTGELLHVNRIESPFGSGWGLAGLQELVENEDGSVLSVDGDGGELLFGPPSTPDGPYISPPGDFSILQRLSDRTWRRREKDGTVSIFNSRNQLSIYQ